MPDSPEQDVYTRLALLWSDVIWGWLDHLPSTGALQRILKENLNEEEAQALSEIPLKPVPLEFVGLDEIASKSSFPRQKLEHILDWCIGCGVCVPRCSADAIRLVEKEKKPAQSTDFAHLYMQINKERAAVREKTA